MLVAVGWFQMMLGGSRGKFWMMVFGGEPVGYLTVNT